MANRDLFVTYQELGTVTEELQEKIKGEADMTVLARWLKLAARAETLEQFLRNM